MANKPKYTYEFASYPKSLTPAHSFKDADDSVASMINHVKDLQAAGLYNDAAQYIKQNEAVLGDYVIDTEYLNLIDETTRNLEIFCNEVADSFTTSPQSIFYQSTEPYAKAFDIWVSDNNIPTTNISGTATDPYVLEDLTYYDINNASGVLHTGAMRNFSGKDINTNSFKIQDKNVLINISRDGYYDINSSLSVNSKSLGNFLSNAINNNILDITDLGNLNNNISTNLMSMNLIKYMNNNSISCSIDDTIFVLGMSNRAFNEKTNNVTLIHELITGNTPYYYYFVKLYKATDNFISFDFSNGNSTQTIYYSIL